MQSKRWSWNCVKLNWKNFTIFKFQQIQNIIHSRSPQSHNINRNYPIEFRLIQSVRLWLFIIKNNAGQKRQWIKKYQSQLVSIYMNSFRLISLLSLSLVVPCTWAMAPRNPKKHAPLRWNQRAQFLLRPAQSRWNEPAMLVGQHHYKYDNINSIIICRLTYKHKRKEEKKLNRSAHQ